MRSLPRFHFNMLGLFLLVHSGIAQADTLLELEIEREKKVMTACLDKLGDQSLRRYESYKCYSGLFRNLQEKLKDSGGRETHLVLTLSELQLHNNLFDLHRSNPKSFRPHELNRMGRRYRSLLHLLETSGELDEWQRQGQWFFEAIVLPDAELKLRGPERQAYEALGRIYYAQGRYIASAEMYGQAFAIDEHSDLTDEDAENLSNWGGALFAAGRPRKAATVFRRAVAAFSDRQLDLKRPARFALIKAKQGRLAALLGNHLEASALINEAEAIARPIADGGVLEIQAAKKELHGSEARPHRKQGIDLRQAELSSSTGLNLISKGSNRYGPEIRRSRPELHPATVPHLLDATATLLDIATYYRSVAEFATAEELLRLALKVDTENLGKDHPSVAVVRNNLGNLFYATNRFELAGDEFESAVRILERGEANHPRVAAALQNAALARIEQGKAHEADRLFSRSASIIAIALDSFHPSRAIILHNQAQAKRALGELKAALELEQEAHSIVEKVYGDLHPLTAQTQQQIAALTAELGNTTEAVAALQSTSKGIEASTRVLSGLGSESKKIAYFKAIWQDSDRLIGFQLEHAPHSEAATRVALTTILRRKARVLDAVSDTVAALRSRSNKADSALLGELSEVREELASAILFGPEESLAHYTSRIDKLKSRQEALEQRVTDSAASLLDIAPPVTAASVTQALPPRSALIEYTVYRPTLSGGRWGERQLAAYVLRPDGSVSGKKLGQYSPIAARIAQFRQMLQKRADVAALRVLATQLHGQLIAPLEKMTGDAEELFIAPEAQLNLMPFESLVDGEGRFLIERHLLTYLTTGRELAAKKPKKEGPTYQAIFANPSFEIPLTNDVPLADGVGFLSNAHFSPLPGTATEANRIAKNLAQSRSFLGEEATKKALKAQRSPQILHIATHGFFMSQTLLGGASTRGLHLAPESLRGDVPVVENPLLRSGIALAGANQKGKERSTGILTALEASALELTGTQLVVLSACETGVGKIELDDGVYGLRRALHVAGAQTQVMSLWKVDDEMTALLMENYYQQLQSGNGRSNAMRDAKLALLSKSESAHPYFWAGFIVSGDPNTLSGEHRGPTVLPGNQQGAQVKPNMRGCHYSPAGASASGLQVPIALGLFLLLGFRRLRRRSPSDSSASLMH